MKNVWDVDRQFHEVQDAYLRSNAHLVGLYVYYHPNDKINTHSTLPQNLKISLLLFFPPPLYLPLYHQRVPMWSFKVRKPTKYSIVSHATPPTVSEASIPLLPGTLSQRANCQRPGRLDLGPEHLKRPYRDTSCMIQYLSLNNLLLFSFFSAAAYVVQLGVLIRSFCLRRYDVRY